MNGFPQADVPSRHPQAIHWQCLPLHMTLSRWNSWTSTGVPWAFGTPPLEIVHFSTFSLGRSHLDTPIAGSIYFRARLQRKKKLVPEYHLPALAATRASRQITSLYIVRLLRHPPRETLAMLPSEHIAATVSEQGPQGRISCTLSFRQRSVEVAAILPLARSLGAGRQCGCVRSLGF